MTVRAERLTEIIVETFRLFQKTGKGEEALARYLSIHEDLTRVEREAVTRIVMDLLAETRALAGAAPLCH